MIELRCTGLRTSGVRCGALLGKIEVREGQAVVEIKCYRGGCKHLNTIKVSDRERASR